MSAEQQQQQQQQQQQEPPNNPWSTARLKPTGITTSSSSANTTSPTTNNKPANVNAKYRVQSKGVPAPSTCASPIPFALVVPTAAASSLQEVAQQRPPLRQTGLLSPITSEQRRGSYHGPVGDAQMLPTATTPTPTTQQASTTRRSSVPKNYFSTSTSNKPPPPTTIIIDIPTTTTTTTAAEAPQQRRRSTNTSTVPAVPQGWNSARLAKTGSDRQLWDSTTTPPQQQQQQQQPPNDQQPPNAQQEQQEQSMEQPPMMDLDPSYAERYQDDQEPQQQQYQPPRQSQRQSQSSPNPAFMTMMMADNYNQNQNQNQPPISSSSSPPPQRIQISTGEDKSSPNKNNIGRLNNNNNNNNNKKKKKRPPGHIEKDGTPYWMKKLKKKIANGKVFPTRPQDLPFYVPPPPEKTHNDLPLPVLSPAPPSSQLQSPSASPLPPWATAKLRSTGHAEAVLKGQDIKPRSASAASSLADDTDNMIMKPYQQQHQQQQQQPHPQPQHHQVVVQPTSPMPQRSVKDTEAPVPDALAAQQQQRQQQQQQQAQQQVVPPVSKQSERNLSPWEELQLKQQQLQLRLQEKQQQQQPLQRTIDDQQSLSPVVPPPSVSTQTQTQKQVVAAPSPIPKQQFSHRASSASPHINTRTRASPTPPPLPPQQQQQQQYPKYRAASPVRTPSPPVWATSSSSPKVMLRSTPNSPMPSQRPSPTPPTMSRPPSWVESKPKLKATGNVEALRYSLDIPSLTRPQHYQKYVPQPFEDHPEMLREREAKAKAKAKAKAAAVKQHAAKPPILTVTSPSPKHRDDIHHTDTDADADTDAVVNDDDLSWSGVSALTDPVVIEPPPPDDLDSGNSAAPQPSWASGAVKLKSTGKKRDLWPDGSPKHIIDAGEEDDQKPEEPPTPIQANTRKDRGLKDTAAGATPKAKSKTVATTNKDDDKPKDPFTTSVTMTITVTTTSNKPDFNAVSSESGIPAAAAAAIAAVAAVNKEQQPAWAGKLKPTGLADHVMKGVDIKSDSDHDASQRRASWQRVVSPTEPFDEAPSVGSGSNTNVTAIAPETAPVVASPQLPPRGRATIPRNAVPSPVRPPIATRAQARASSHEPNQQQQHQQQQSQYGSYSIPKTRSSSLGPSPPSPQPSWAMERPKLKATGLADKVPKGMDIKPIKTTTTDSVSPRSSSLPPPTTAYSDVVAQSRTPADNTVRAKPLWAAGRPSLKTTGHADDVLRGADIKTRSAFSPALTPRSTALQHSLNSLKSTREDRFSMPMTSQVASEQQQQEQGQPASSVFRVALRSTGHADAVKRGADIVRLKDKKKIREPEKEQFLATLEANRKVLRRVSKTDSELPSDEELDVSSSQEEDTATKKSLQDDVGPEDPASLYKLPLKKVPAVRSEQTEESKAQPFTGSSFPFSRLVVITGSAKLEDAPDGSKKLVLSGSASMDPPKDKSEPFLGNSAGETNKPATIGSREQSALKSNSSSEKPDDARQVLIEEAEATVEVSLTPIMAAKKGTDEAASPSRDSAKTPVPVEVGSEKSAPSSPALKRSKSEQSSSPSVTFAVDDNDRPSLSRSSSRGVSDAEKAKDETEKTLDVSDESDDDERTCEVDHESEFDAVEVAFIGSDDPPESPLKVGASPRFATIEDDLARHPRDSPSRPCGSLRFANVEDDLARYPRDSPGRIMTTPVSSGWTPGARTSPVAPAWTPSTYGEVAAMEAYVPDDPPSADMADAPATFDDTFVSRDPPGPSLSLSEEELEQLLEESFASVTEGDAHETQADSTGMLDDDEPQDVTAAESKSLETVVPATNAILPQEEAINKFSRPAPPNRGVSAHASAELKPNSFEFSFVINAPETGASSLPQPQVNSTKSTDSLSPKYVGSPLRIGVGADVKKGTIPAATGDTAADLHNDYSSQVTGVTASSSVHDESTAPSIRPSSSMQASIPEEGGASRPRGRSKTPVRWAENAAEHFTSQRRPTVDHAPEEAAHSPPFRSLSPKAERRSPSPTRGGSPVLWTAEKAAEFVTSPVHLKSPVRTEAISRKTPSTRPTPRGRSESPARMDTKTSVLSPSKSVSPSKGRGRSKSPVRWTKESAAEYLTSPVRIKSKSPVRFRSPPKEATQARSKSPTLPPDEDPSSPSPSKSRARSRSPRKETPHSKFPVRPSTDTSSDIDKEPAAARSLSPIPRSKSHVRTSESPKKASSGDVHGIIQPPYMSRSIPLSPEAQQNALEEAEDHQHSITSHDDDNDDKKAEPSSPVVDKLPGDVGEGLGPPPPLAIASPDGKALDAAVVSSGSGGLVRRIKPRRCAHCNAVETDGSKFKYCGKCRLVKYCSRHCQKKNWKTHKQDCCKQIQQQMYGV